MENKGYDLIKEGEYLKALDMFSRVLENEPENLAGLIGFAKCKFHLGEFDDSLKILLRIINMDPDTPEPYLLAGIIFGERKFYKDAFNYLQQAIELDSGYFEAYINKGIFQVELGDYTAAERTFIVARDINPNSWKSYNNLGVTYARQKKHGEAYKEFYQAYRLNPSIELFRGTLYNFVVGNTIFVFPLLMVLFALISQSLLLSLILIGILFIFQLYWGFTALKTKHWKKSIIHFLASVLLVILFYSFCRFN